MRYIVDHPLPSGTTLEDIQKLSQQIRNDPQVKGICSYFNLSEGRGFCVMDAPSRERLIAWFDQNNLHYDSITLVECQGEADRWVDLRSKSTVSAGR